MTNALIDTHARRSVEVALGRTADYFGPGANHSTLGELALRGKTAQIMGATPTVSTATPTRPTWPPG